MSDQIETTGFEMPAAVAWLNYVGDVRGSIGNVMGPMYGSDQMLTVVEEHYDPDTDRTRLGLTYGEIAIPEGARPDTDHEQIVNVKGD